MVEDIYYLMRLHSIREQANDMKFYEIGFGGGVELGLGLWYYF